MKSSLIDWCTNPKMKLVYFQIQNPHDEAHRKDSASKAKNFLKNLTSRSFVYMIHFLRDILTALSDLSKAFQRQGILIGEVLSEIEAAHMIVSSYENR